MLKYPQIDWTPAPEGIVLGIGEKDCLLSSNAVTELRDDMEEAYFLSRGYNKVDCMTEEVNPKDIIVVLGNAYWVHDVLTERPRGPYDEIQVVIQFTLDRYSSVSAEITLPGDLQVTVWRPIE